jgi:hypothetical protein
MRTFLFTFCASLAIAAPAAAANRNFGITSFTKVRVEGPFKVSLATDVAPFAKATGSSAAIDRVDVEVSGETLVVRPSASSWGGYPGSDPGPVEISLGTHDLTNAWLNGAGTLTIDRVRGLSFALSVQGSGRGVIGAVNSDQMSVSVIGSGSARLAGRTKKLTAIVRGIASVDAADLAATDATIGAEGTSTIDANVTDTATVDTSGPATIRLTGRPSCTLKVAGSTSVSGCK